MREWPNCAAGMAQARGGRAATIVVGMDSTDDGELDAFWTDAKIRAGLNPASAYGGPIVDDTLPPPAWSFGADPAQADRLLELVLEGTKTATSSALWDYEAADDPLPEPGDLSIVLDSGGHPRALLRTTRVRVVPFDEVDADHARAEGEGDRSLDSWRAAHRVFFAENAAHDRGFAPDMPVVLESFEVLVPEHLRPTRPRMFGR